MRQLLTPEELSADAACVEIEAALAELQRLAGAHPAVATAVHEGVAALRMPTGQQLADRVIGVPLNISFHEDHRGMIQSATITKLGGATMLRIAFHDGGRGRPVGATVTRHEVIEAAA